MYVRRSQERASHRARRHGCSSRSDRVAVTIGLSGVGAVAAAGEIRAARETASITVSSLIIPERKTTEGILVRSTSAIWSEIVQKLGSDWNLAFQLTPDQWEELIAGAFHKEGYEVTKTPRSGDHGRDIIAIKHGFGCVKILGSVKADKPDHLVEYDAVRAVVGVVTADQKASKGIITTTSDFPPLMENDPSIAPFLPTRLELVDGKRLQQWLNELRASRVMFDSGKFPPCVPYVMPLARSTFWLISGVTPIQ